MPPIATEVETPQITVKPSRVESRRWVPLAFAAVYLLWGSTYIGIRIAIESIPPLAMAAIRHSIVGLILYPILRWKTGFKPSAANWWTAAITGLQCAAIARRCRLLGVVWPFSHARAVRSLTPVHAIIVLAARRLAPSSSRSAVPMNSAS